MNWHVKRALHVAARAHLREITVAYPRGVDERYSLFRFQRGEVYWRLDEFRLAEDPRDGSEWTAHERLTVAEVIARLPEHAELVRQWTRKEIESGTVIADDIFSEMTREEALARLATELTATERGGAEAA